MIDWFEWAISNYSNQHHTVPQYHPESDLLLHDGLVFASIVKEGPSLMAVVGDGKCAGQGWRCREQRSRARHRYLAPAAAPALSTALCAGRHRGQSI